MFASEQPDWRLILGIGASVLLHLGVAAALAWQAGAEAESAADAAELREPDRLRPGIRNSSATTITWIGYEEPTPQQAEQAPVDQAAQTRAQAPPSAPPVTSLDEDLVPPPAPERSEQAAPELASAQSESTEEPEADPVAPVPASETAPEKPDASREERAPPDSQTERRSESPDRARAGRESDDAPKAPPAPETGERQPAPETEEAEPGEPSDRESPAASREPPIEVRLGRPAAREGVYIETVRPRWTHFTVITTRPSDPLVEVHFNSEGRVAFAEILESGGSRQVDGPLLDAIYNWTARGERIDALRPDTKEREGERAVLRFRIGLRG